MLDIQWIVKNSEIVKENAKNKGFDVDIDALIRLDVKRRGILHELESIQAKQNEHNPRIAAASGREKQNLIAEMKTLSIQAKDLSERLRTCEEAFHERMLEVPQIAVAKTPVDPSGKGNVPEYERGKIPHFDFPPKTHIALGKSLDIIDTERGVKLMGSRGYFLKNDGALLEMAILKYAFDFLAQRGFSLMSVPAMAHERFFYGTGYFPWMKNEIFTAQDKERSFRLIGSAEVPLTSYYTDEILDESELPIRMTAFSPCFRTEVGSYGKDTQGLYRLRQFYKVEQVILCESDDRTEEKHFYEILQNAEDFLENLEIPYRVLRLCTGDMGAGQREKFDIESWMPSRDSYGETHSCSRFGDWQSRRLNIRYKSADGKKRFVSTLNNTLIASPRILIPLLENHQTSEGSVRIPTVLHPYMLGKTHIVPL